MKNKYSMLLFFVFTIILVGCNHGSGLIPADLDKNTSVTPPSDKMSVFNSFKNLKPKLPSSTIGVLGDPTPVPYPYTNVQNIDYFTNPNFVFFGSTLNSYEINTSMGGPPLSGVFQNIFILEFRKNPNGLDDIIVNFSFVNERRLRDGGDVTVNALYNARTLLPTKVEAVENGTNGIDFFLGIWPTFQKITHENLAVTNGATFGFVTILQSAIYTNIVAGTHNLYNGNRNGVLTTNDIKTLTLISPSASIDEIRVLAQNKLWKSIAVQKNITPSEQPKPVTSANYFLKDDGSLAIDSTGTNKSIGFASPSTFTYAWDIFKYETSSSLPGDNDAFIYVYRKMRLIIKEDPRTTDEESFDSIALVPPLRTGVDPVPYQLPPSGVLVRLSIKP